MFSKTMRHANGFDALSGHCSALMRAVMTVAWRTVVPTLLRTSVVRILSALPISSIISGSQRVVKTSPTIGSSVEKGRRTSSSLPFMKLKSRGHWLVSRRAVVARHWQGERRTRAS
jgi:hypothetical protein